MPLRQNTALNQTTTLPNMPSFLIEFMNDLSLTQASKRTPIFCPEHP
jgi:hypothetical protein